MYQKKLLFLVRVTLENSHSVFKTDHDFFTEMRGSHIAKKVFLQRPPPRPQLRTALGCSELKKSYFIYNANNSLKFMIYKKVAKFSGTFQNCQNWKNNFLLSPKKIEKCQKNGTLFLNFFQQYFMW